jgi:signal transduction histidine kinase/ligand-binding sensor domain-containing protein
MTGKWMGLALWGLALCALRVHAQEADRAPRPVTLAELSCVPRTWGVDAGLLGTRPYSMAQTRDGYLWVGSREGLFRFNGSAFTRFNTAEIPEVGHRFIPALCADHEGRLWIGTGIFRVSYLEDERFVRVEGVENYGELDTWVAHPDGGVVAGLHSNGTDTILRLTPSGHQVLASGRLRAGRIASLAVSSDGALWAATRAGELMRVADGKFERVEGDLKADRGAAVLLSRRDGVLVSVGRQGIYEYRDGEWQLGARFDPPPSIGEPVRHAAEDAQGNLWFGTAQSGHWIWSEGAPLRRLVPGRGSAPSPITEMMSDAEGNVWMASFSGLYQARYSPFVTRVPPGEIPTPRVVSIAVDGQGTIWFSCFGGICGLGPGDHEPFVALRRPTTEINNVAGAPDGGFWYINKSGVLVRWRERELEANRAPSPDGGPIRAFTGSGLLAADDGVVWATHVHGMLRHRPEAGLSELETVSEEEGLPGLYLLQPRKGPNGELMVAARTDGIYRKRPGESRWERVTPSGDPVGAAVRVMDIASDGSVWAVGAGDPWLACWRADGAWSAPLSDLELDRGPVVGLVCGRDGGLWVATEYAGVAHVDRDELLARLREPGRPLSVTWFDRSSGLGSKGGSFSASAIAQSPDGTIWVATESGLSSISPRQWQAHRERLRSPRMAIEKVTADGRDLPWDGVARIPAGTVRLAIRYTDLSFGLPGEVSFRHRLLGFDENWIEGGSDGEASFFKAPPGTYRFEATAANRYGEWNPEPASVDLIIAPLWWQRGAVRWGALGLVAMGVLVYYRGRLASLREKESMHAAFSRQLIDSQEKERQRLARELHDSLGPNLTIVKNRLTLEQERLAGTADPAPALQAISKVITQTIQEVRHISQNLRPYALDRAGLTRAIAELAANIAEATRIPIHCDLAPIDGALPPAHEINLYRIVQEALNNIVRHADASQAWLSIQRADRALRVRIADDGRGFTPDPHRGARGVSGGMGLLSMEERARIMGATFQCKTARREGVTLLMEIPIASRQDLA